MPKPIAVMSSGAYLVFHAEFDKFADDVNTLAFRADNRHPRTIFEQGFVRKSLRLGGDAITFRPERGDIAPEGAVCVSTRPEVAATFPLSQPDGRYTPTWIYAFYIKRAIWVAATNDLSLDATATKAADAAREALEKAAFAPDWETMKIAMGDSDTKGKAADAAKKKADAARGRMKWAGELAVLTVAATDIICAFDVSRRYDAFLIGAIQKDHKNPGCTFAGSYVAACEKVDHMRNEWVPYVNEGRVLDSELKKRQEYFESKRPSST